MAPSAGAGQSGNASVRAGYLEVMLTSNHDPVLEKTEEPLPSKSSHIARTWVQVGSARLRPRQRVSTELDPPPDAGREGFRTTRSSSEPMLGMRLDRWRVVVDRTMNPEFLDGCDDACRPSVLQSRSSNSAVAFHSVFRRLFDGVSGEIVGRNSCSWLSEVDDTIEHGKIGSNLARVVNLVPRIPNKRNSGALSLEPFDMSGLNFQSLKLVELEREALEIG
jgi:hypothetical protein